MKRALYVGKFQPWHLGHESILEYIAAAPDIDEIVIGIGSSQWNWQNRNPDRPWLSNIFTWQERKAIIDNSLRGRVFKKVHIVPILDFLPYWGDISTPQWLGYIRRNLPQFHCLYTNRQKEVELFSRVGYEARPHPLQYGFSATLVREKMARGEMWQPFVLPEAEEIIRKIGGEKRAAELYAKAEFRPEDYEDFSWEWRTFDRPSEEEIKRILALPVYRDENIRDQYLVSLASAGVNCKLRRGALKFKLLLTVQDGFEAWASASCALPVSRDDLFAGCGEIRFPLPYLLPNIGRKTGDISGEELLDVVGTEYNPYLFLLSLEKKRFMRLFQEGSSRCGVDITLFSLGGRTVVTIGLDAKKQEDAAIALERLGLAKYKPMNYLQFLERYVDKEASRDVWKKL